MLLGTSGLCIVEARTGQDTSHMSTISSELLPIFLLDQTGGSPTQAPERDHDEAIFGNLMSTLGLALLLSILTVPQVQKYLQDNEHRNVLCILV